MDCQLEGRAPRPQRSYEVRLEDLNFPPKYEILDLLQIVGILTIGQGVYAARPPPLPNRVTHKHPVFRQASSVLDF